MAEFTPGQARRIEETVAVYKPSLCLQMPGGSCYGGACRTFVASISRPKTVCLYKTLTTFLYKHGRRG
jgi:hypothetical protein